MLEIATNTVAFANEFFVVVHRSTGSVLEFQQNELQNRQEFVTLMNNQAAAGLPRSGKSQGKTKIFQGQGKVREFCKRSWKISVLVKVSEKSGNFVFWFCEVYEDIFIRKMKL